ncbi:MAG: hypothetical protein LKM30_00360 [Bacilli bacterium]|nr:hypothetical protein [Bacilli bacterium]
MSRSNHRIATSLLALAMLTLASCSTTKIKYPTDYNSTLYSDVDTFAADKAVTVVENNKEQYYKNVLSTEGVYKEAVNQILLAIASEAHNYDATTKTGTNVNAVSSDAITASSVLDSTTLPTLSAKNENLQNRAKLSMESTSRNGTYAKDNLFYENKFLTSLKENFTLGAGNADVTLNDLNGLLVTPFMTYDNIYGTDSKNNDNITRYQYYFKNSLYEDMQINYLTSEYIYNKTYSAIGNSNARNVQVIALTDRSDEQAIGSAKKLLDAYVRDYIKGSGTVTNLVGTDKDFSVLSRLWKGISKDVIDGVSTTDTDADLEKRYGLVNGTRNSTSVVLTDDEKAWLKTNGLIGDDVRQNNYTLAGKVTKDQDTLDKGIADLNKADTTLESTYTGSYTYDIATGVRKAIDDIATKSLVTKGVYLKSDGLSSLPTALKERVFSLDMTTSADDITYMKANPDTSKDSITVYEKDGFRYVTKTGTLNGSDTDNIIYYDSSSKTYYLVRILDVASSSSLSTTNTDSMYSADQKAYFARQIAYAMSTTGTYKTDSAIYWLRRTKISYSDDAFLTYMKTNYKDLFKTTSSVDSEDKISIANLNFGSWFD